MAGSEPVERFFQTHVSETKPITAVSAGASFQGRSSGQSPAALSFRPDGARSRVAVHPTTDRKDKPLDLPLLELDQELWDREGQRLTVLFDPGRIKRGVLPRDEVGSALFEGSAYTLVIDSKWHDANGAPHSGAAGFLQRSVDRRLSLLRWIMPCCTVCSSSQPDGTGEWRHNSRPPGTQWRFVPYAAWTTGDYSLQVDTALEDVAGNRVGRPFEVDTFEPLTAKITPRTESIPFRIDF